MHEGNFGTMTAVKGANIVPVPLEDATGPVREVPVEYSDLLRAFMG